jgi:hypothetical protein
LSAANLAAEIFGELRSIYQELENQEKYKKYLSETKR